MLRHILTELLSIGTQQRGMIDGVSTIVSIGLRIFQGCYITFAARKYRKNYDRKELKLGPLHPNDCSRPRVRLSATFADVRELFERKRADGPPTVCPPNKRTELLKTSSLWRDSELAPQVSTGSSDCKRGEGACHR